MSKLFEKTSNVEESMHPYSSDMHVESFELSGIMTLKRLCASPHKVLWYKHNEPFPILIWISFYILWVYYLAREPVEQIFVFNKLLMNSNDLTLHTQQQLYVLIIDLS